MEPPRLSIFERPFKKPIKVTEKLSIQYVWIDSLCIIQDSAEDWRLEYSRMGDVQWSQFMGRGLEPMGRAGQAFSFRPTL
jgi:hypothetical protein